MMAGPAALGMDWVVDADTDLDWYIAATAAAFSNFKIEAY